MLINKKSQTDLSGFYVVFNGSVLNENATNYGISHLCEHLKCRMFNKLYNIFDRYNVTWNAYTSDEYIVFYIKGLDEYINEYKKEFLDCLMKKFNISKEDFEIEKKVVIEEYKDYFQDQSANFYANICRKTYHSYGAIGKLQALEKINYEQLKEYWNKYLLLPYKIINISKTNDFKTDIKFNDKLKTHYIPDKKDELILEKSIDYDKIAVIGYILLSENEPYNKISYVLDMLGLNSLSPFWNELREKRGLTYGVSTWVDSISENQGIASSSLITTPNNVKKVLETYKEILTNVDKYLTLERFEIVKDYYTIRKKRNEIELYQNIDDYLINDNWNIDKILDTITYEECKEIFNEYLTFDKWIFETDKNNTNECLTFDKWIFKADKDEFK